MRAIGLATVADSGVQRTSSGAEDTQGKHKQDDARSRSVHSFAAYCLFESPARVTTAQLDVPTSCASPNGWECRSQLLYLLFVIALAAGFVTAQYLYIWAQDVDPDDVAPTRQRQLVSSCLRIEHARACNIDGLHRRARPMHMV